MKKTNFLSGSSFGSLFSSLALIALSIIGSASAQANVGTGVELVVTGDKGASVSEIERVRAHSSVRRSSPVFDETERRALEQMGETSLARSIKIVVENDARAIELAGWAKRQGLKVKFEKNALAFSLQANQRPDRFYSRQWGLENVGQTELLALDDLTSLPIIGRIGEDVGIRRAPPERMDASHTITVAVLDTGVDYEHPDLQGQLVEKPSECRALVEFTKCHTDAKNTAEKSACDVKYATVDTDGNGYPLDCSGWNTTARMSPASKVWGDANAADLNGHGTHVAGVIGARANDIGIRGVMKNVKILPVKVISSSPTEPVRPASAPYSVANAARASLSPLPSPIETDLKAARGFGDLIARGILYSIRSGAQVINMSLGWPADVESNLMRQMIDLAKNRGVLIVAAAGNDSTDALIRPCVYSGVICVGSHDPNGAMSNFSNFGSGVDIAAPGMNILSTFPSNILSVHFTEAVGYEVKNGTSMASPYVAGVLGRLLNAGVPSQDVYARLMAGARPQQASTVRSTTQAPMYTLGGNADLARALVVAPQPLILPFEKSPIGILWNRVDRTVAFSFPLKNVWADAQNVSVTARLLVRGQVTSDATLSVAQWDLGSWKAQETKRLDTALVINDPRLESELKIEITVQADSLPPRSFALQGDVRVPLSTGLVDPEFKTLPITGAASIKGASLRTVTSLDDRSEQDYFAIEQVDTQMRLSLVKDGGASGYSVTAQIEESAPAGELLLLQRLDLNADNVSDYALIYRISPTAEQRQPSFKILTYDSRLQPLSVTLDGKTSASTHFNNSDTVMADRFQWMTLNGRRVPAWVSRGTTPALEKAAFDPWDPEPLDAPDYRIYFIGTDGLRLIKAPKDHSVIAMLNLSPDQRRRGALPILFAKGRGTEMEYGIGEAINGKLENFKTISLGRFRALRGSDLKELTDLSLTNVQSGTVFSTDSFRGAVRATTLIDRWNLNDIIDNIIDQTIRASGTADTVTKIAGVFAGDRRSATISQTIYEVQYTDHISNATATTSLRRFSFLPGFFFFNIFFPAALNDTVNPSGDRLPGVYVPSGLGLSQGLEVIAPRYDRSGKLEGLVRPARLRLDAGAGCEALGNALPATRTQPTQVMFFCGDRFVKVPLSY